MIQTITVWRCMMIKTVETEVAGAKTTDVISVVLAGDSEDNVKAENDGQSIENGDLLRLSKDDVEVEDE